VLADLMTARAQTFRGFAIHLFDAILRLVVMLFLVPYGLTAVAFGAVITTAVTASVIWVVAMPSLSVPLSSFGAMLARSACPGLAAAFPGLMLSTTGWFQHLGPGLMISTSGVIGAALWFLSTRLLRHPVYGEVLHWIGAALRAAKLRERRDG
jgi:hypothetical protein